MAWYWWVILVTIGWIMFSFGAGPLIAPWVEKRVHVKGGEQWTSGDSGTGSTDRDTTE